MRQFKYKPPRLHSGELRTPVSFYEDTPSDGPEPGSSIGEVPVYECYGKIDEVWAKDVELAKSNGTLSDITVVIRDPMGDFVPRNDKHYLSIEDERYRDVLYNVKHVQPDLQQKDFINVIAGVSS
ncbi:phage head-tail adapter protein [Sediminibacillus halophilus]|uniref:Phage head-tail joining protein n=1 Tax=Sediminibacillus halophilus TaxID=482461 RepID=A0A1G9QUT8_9BACI|nr:phage head-tail adapter protein [Sediminibacillus halophilus]SDM14776.1 hypothetical protein SAMN05216244_1676 [Sediminibacillus halophilus]